MHIVMRILPRIVYLSGIQATDGVLQKAAASAFAQMLRRYTGLNHLAQAARTVLQNKAQVNKMYQDLCKVDFVHIQVDYLAFTLLIIYLFNTFTARCRVHMLLGIKRHLM